MSKKKGPEGYEIGDIMAMEPVKVMSLLVSAGGMAVTLRPPGPEVLGLIQDAEQISKQAETYVVTNDDEYKLADLMWTQLKNSADEVETGRTDTTKGLNKVKVGWDNMFTPARDMYLTGASAIHKTMLAYENKKKLQARIDSEEQQRLADQEKERLANEAAELLKKAEGAKSLSKKQEFERRAAEVEVVSRMIPTSFAVPEDAVPETASSVRAKPWTGEVTDKEAFMKWLLKNDTWLEMVEFRQSGLNSLAKMVTNAKEIPGFKSFQDQQRRRDPRKAGRS